MKLKKQTSLLVLTVVLSILSPDLKLKVSAIQRALTCDLQSKQIPPLRGFHLGMTINQVLQRHPKINTKELQHIKPDINGYAELKLSKAINPTLEEYLYKTDVNGLDSIKLCFFDNRLVKLEVAYDGFTEWGNVSRFLEVLISPLKLPDASHWEKGKETINNGRITISESLRLSCDGFRIEVTLQPRLGKYDLERPSITFAELGYEAEIKEREKTLVERQRKKFKP